MHAAWNKAALCLSVFACSWWNVAVADHLAADALVVEFDRLLEAADDERKLPAVDQAIIAVADRELEDFVLVQQTAPLGPAANRSPAFSSRNGGGGPSGQSPSARTARRSRVPYMIGDTASGTCGTLTFDGASFANVEHPTFACSRLNIAENNSPLPQDRVFFSYRHFHNISETNVFEDFNALEIDLFTLGLEKTFNQGESSLELRIPIARELNSNLQIFETPAISTLPLSDRNGEFGNMSVVFKRLLFEYGDWVVSGGVAVNIPTADDVVIDGDFDARIGLIETPVVIDATADFTFDAVVNNDTVNLSPYLAWQWTSRCRDWFHQGFFQIDVPMNRSRAVVQIDGVVTPDFVLPPEVLDVDTAGRLDQQTLMRLNLGFGYWLHRGAERDWLQGIAAMFEVHYTATLDNASPIRRQVADYVLGPPFNISIPVDLIVGNQFDHVNIVNLTAGVSVDLDDWLITNGFTAPVTSDENKPFDFEYNLQVQRRF